MLNINIAERIITESVYKGPKTINEMITDTSLPLVVTENCIMSLLSKNIIHKELNRYCFNERLTDEAKEALSSNENKLALKKIILNEITDTSNGENISFYKVAMSEREEKVFKGLIYNVEEFLKSLSTSSETKKEKIIFWGGSSYEDVIQSMLA